MSFGKLLAMQAFDWLKAVAQAGQACPSNQDIADRLGFMNLDTSIRLLKDLEKRGLIKVERFQTSRLVTIVETGAQTLRPANAKPHWRDRLRTAPPAEAAAIGGTAVPTAKPRVSAAVIRAAAADGRDLPTFVTALIDMGLECWRDERGLPAGQREAN